MNKSIKQILSCELEKESYTISGWVRSVRQSSESIGFCNVNDGSNVDGLQVVLIDTMIDKKLIEKFFSNVNLGVYITCIGKIINSPGKGQKYEMLLEEYKIVGTVDNDYPLCKSKMNLDTLRNFIHLRARTNTFGSVFRIRSSLMKILHDYFHEKGYLHLDPNIITTNECEGGAGVFQVTEKDLTNVKNLSLTKEGNYNWSKDHFCDPVYLTVSSQLQLEAMACALGNVYTVNKSFRSEHSSTSKHVSEFTHLEIEIVNNTLDDLMNVAEDMIKWSITQLLERNLEDIENLGKFVSKDLKDRLVKLKNSEFMKITYLESIEIINKDIQSGKTDITSIVYGDDLGSDHENYLTKIYDSPVFITHWPLEIKSFYMKQCSNGLCESFDLLMPYGIGELIGASQREDDFTKLHDIVKKKNINLKGSLDFYLDLRRFGSCPHGGFGLGFDRLLMLMTGLSSIKDVIPFPVYYKSCKY